MDRDAIFCLIYLTSPLSHSALIVKNLSLEWQIWWGTSDDPTLCRPAMPPGSADVSPALASPFFSQPCNSPTGFSVVGSSEEEPEGAAWEWRSHFRAQMATQQWGGRTWRAQQTSAQDGWKISVTCSFSFLWPPAGSHPIIFHISDCS